MFAAGQQQRSQRPERTPASPGGVRHDRSRGRWTSGLSVVGAAFDRGCDSLGVCTPVCDSGGDALAGGTAVASRAESSSLSGFIVMGDSPIGLEGTAPGGAAL